MSVCLASSASPKVKTAKYGPRSRSARAPTTRAMAPPTAAPASTGSGHARRPPTTAVAQAPAPKNAPVASGAHRGGAARRAHAAGAAEPARTHGAAGRARATAQSRTRLAANEARGLEDQDESEHGVRGDEPDIRRGEVHAHRVHHPEQQGGEQASRDIAETAQDDDDER